MDPRHRFGGSMRLLIVFVPLAITAALSCTPPDETSRSEESTNPGIGISHSSRAATTASLAVFESGQVRPLAISPDKQHLFAVNTPDYRLEIFRIKTHHLIHTTSIPVGLEPVAVAARTDRE